MAPSSGRTPPGTQNGKTSAAAINEWNTLDLKVSQWIDGLIEWRANRFQPAFGVGGCN